MGKLMTRLKTMFKTLISNEKLRLIIQNSSWLVIDKLVNLLIGIFIGAMIARYFGPAKFGLFNYSIAIVSLLTVFSTLGLETITFKNLLEKKYEEGSILFTSLLLRLIGGTGLTISATLVVKLLEPQNYTLIWLVFFMSCTMIFKSFEIIEYWFQAHHKSKTPSILRMTIYIVISLLKIILVIFDGSIIQLSILYLFEAILFGFSIFAMYFYLRKANSKWSLSGEYAKEVLHKSWYLILSGFMITLYMRIDQVMLGSMLKDKSVLGVFSVAVRIAEMWYFIPISVITSFKPIIINNKKMSEKKYLDSLQLLYTVIAWLGISVGFMIFFASKTMIQLLYGNEYIEAANILSISVWAGTFAMLGTARAVWIVCENLQKFTLIYTFFGLLMNVFLNWMLIPKYGAYGSAFATLVAQLTALVLLSMFSETRTSNLMIARAFIFKIKARP
ncbi:flippase [Cohnella sp. GCM10012308]|uniref:flippase n=1 Tax=Cohnella sp. GCM10012308 TaxID=3317329 RepID=UPI00361B2E9F